ncbi:hypothetical protein [Sulfuricurvum sp.]|uniref:hypothetical protein n=1 Tax=Sulfuricurvum sp. TaxID=2025608 RepID=UPI00356B5471
MAVDDIDPRKVVKDFILANFTITGWTTKVNEAYFETNRQDERQIYLTGKDGKFQPITNYQQRDMDRSSSPTIYQASIFVHVSGYNEDIRREMVHEMRRIFQNTTLSHNPTDYVDDLIIENDWAIDKNKANDCLTWVQVFEVTVLW